MNFDGKFSSGYCSGEQISQVLGIYVESSVLGYGSSCYNSNCACQWRGEYLQLLGILIGSGDRCVCSSEIVLFVQGKAPEEGMFPVKSVFMSSLMMFFKDKLFIWWKDLCYGEGICCFSKDKFFIWWKDLKQITKTLLILHGKSLGQKKN